MARLTNTVREKMAVTLTKHRFAERAALLVAESQALFRVCYDHHHSAEDQKHIAALVKRHPSGLNKDSAFNTNVGGRRITVGAQQIAKHWRAEMAARYVLGDADNYPGMGFDDKSDTGKRIVEFADAVKLLGDEVDTSYREALGALNQFSTGKKLAEDWPEAMPVIGDLIPEDDRTLPVIQVGRLNERFKLPPGAKLAA